MSNGSVTEWNYSRNFVATQVASEIKRWNMPRNHEVRQRFLLQEALHEVESVFTFRNDFRVLAGKPKLSPFLVNWENVVFIYSIFFII